MQQLLLNLVHLFIQPLHVSASFIRPSSCGYFLSWSLLHLSAKPHVSCFVVHKRLSSGS
jgi:hypothetical protein